MNAFLPLEVLEKLFAAAERAGLPRTLLAGELALPSNGFLSFETVAHAYETAATLIGDPAFGLHVGERTAPDMYGSLGHLLATSSTLGEALDKLIVYQRLWSQAVGFSIERRGSRFRLRYWARGSVPAEMRRQESEQMLATLLTFLQLSCGDKFSPAEVRFEHVAPADLSEHQRIFACPLHFGCTATEITLPVALLDWPVAERDTEVAGLVRQAAENELRSAGRGEEFPTYFEAMAAASLLANGDGSISSLARACRLTPRTLQRRLVDSQLSFREIIAEARTKIAKQLLDTSNLPLALIAFRLGYVRTNAFHRAFRQRTGETPGQYRNRGRHGSNN